jgi:hypothetical protein
MRLVFGLALCLLFASAAIAQTDAPHQEQPQVLTDVFACANTPDDVARLACYDAAVGRLQQAQQQGQVVSIDRERATALQRESFGFTLPNLARLLPSLGGAGSEVARMESEISRVIERPDNRHTFVLANGQTWTEVEPQSAFNVRVGDSITIRRAAFGSFMLISSRGGAAHRVRREN